MTNSKLGEGESTQGLSSFSETLSCILRISNKVFGHLVLQRISLTLHKRLETAVCFQRPSATAGCSPPRTASDCRLLLSQDRQRLQAAREEETLWGVAYPPEGGDRAAAGDEGREATSSASGGLVAASSLPPSGAALVVDRV